MIDRLKRIAAANETVAIIESGNYRNSEGKRIDIQSDTQFSIQNSQLFKANEFDTLFSERNQILSNAVKVKTVFEITEETTLEAAERLIQMHSPIFCLNFASAKNPGGGFLTGAQAQEESLARSSALYPCIAQMKAMYSDNKHRNTCLYSDDMIYSPDVPVFRKDNGDLLDAYYKLSFLTSPAVNAGVVREREKNNIEKIDDVMLMRLEKLLSIAVVKGYKTLLLGAWGCGVFRNNPNDVTNYFKHQLIDNQLFSGYFDKVIFAVYSSSKPNKNIVPFVEKLK
jgi:uncharacterized protein (TIGR02452 family)